MRFSNYHTHSDFCDGLGSIDDYCARARLLGFSSLGFSSHAPFPIETDWHMEAGRIGEYRSLVAAAKKAHEGSLEVYLGIEADYLAGMAAPDDGRISSFGLDYVIGSVHYLRSPRGRLFTIDEQADAVGAILASDYEGNGRALAEAYFDALDSMLEKSRFDILGHIDLLKKNNPLLRFFDEDSAWYRERVRGSLELAKRNGCIVEVNTGGMARGKITVPYPDDRILRDMHASGIPVTLNADAHRPEHLDFAFRETLELMRSSGYRTTMQLVGGRWKEMAID
jgi:histidinol-phosphatase (PHP family)